VLAPIKCTDMPFLFAALHQDAGPVAKRVKSNLTQFV
jgi:hypothetical protein